MKKVLPLLVAIGLLLVACGPKAAPTPDPGQVQQTAVAMAFTMAAQTALAQPSPTPVPPTATATLPPPPSPTFPALPTFPPAQPTATVASGDACTGFITSGWGGQSGYIMIDNQTKGSLTFALYLRETPFACGYVPGVSYIGPNQSVGVKVPFGCYWPSAFINDPKKQRAIEGPLGCITGTDKTTLIVSYEGFRWVGP